MIIAQIASLPERSGMLRTTVKSLAHQVDIIRVMLNGYTAPPEWVHDFENLYYVMLDNSTGDAAKFYDVEKLSDDYLLTCDDDLAYPKDYAAYMVSKIEQYQRKAVISLHGRTTTAKPVRSYYRSWADSYRCLDKVPKDFRVNVAGTGVMAFHASTLKLRYEWFAIPNMADIWIAKFCSQQNVPLIVAAHKAEYLTNLDPGCTHPTIWHKHFNDDGVQTELYNSF